MPKREKERSLKWADIWTKFDSLAPVYGKARAGDMVAVRGVVETWMFVG